MAPRCARDIEDFAELALIEFGAGRDAVFDQHLAQAVRDLFMQGGAWDRDDFSTHL
jgi:hypothetical protein